MDDRIKIYESLLNHKGELEKECFALSLDYVLEFGSQVEELFQLKVEVVTLKKKIAFCVQRQYRNQEIDASELNRYIDSEILDYQAKLAELIAFNKAAKENRGPYLAHEDVKKIRKLYYEIVHLIHPDLHPEYEGNVRISGLWDKAVDAYKRNDFHELAEAYDQIIIIIEPSKFEIQDLEAKIARLQDEINAIKEGEPYTYKFILDDEDETQAYHERLDKEIMDYKEYKESLERELKRFRIVERNQA